MKAFRWISGSLAIVALSWLALLLVDGDVVKSSYATLNDARADELFGRGWLPDILPLSAHDIRTANNLDLNTSEGAFRFAPADHASFSRRLSGYAPMRTPFDDFGQHVLEMQREGFSSGVFADENSTWVFFCKFQQGYCEYVMWLRGSEVRKGRI
jgi:hypothetical protein